MSLEIVRRRGEEKPQLSRLQLAEVGIIKFLGNHKLSSQKVLAMFDCMDERKVRAMQEKSYFKTMMQLITDRIQERMKNQGYAEYFVQAKELVGNFSDQAWNHHGPHGHNRQIINTFSEIKSLKKQKEIFRKSRSGDIYLRIVK